jgi:tetratricopeptide (TPR) repeat protein
MTKGPISVVADSEAPHTSIMAPATRRRRLGRALLVTLLGLLFACGLVGMVIAAGLAGAQAGQREASMRATATVAASLLERFDKANALMREGKYALAEANYAYILQYQPENYGVRSLIATAIVAQTPTPLPPTPTPTRVVTDKRQLLQTLVGAGDAQDWDAVIRLADQLVALDSAFEAATVNDLRYRALVERGLSRLRSGQIEQGLYDLDRAAAIRPLSDRVEGERRLAAAYQSTMYYFGADWEKSIAQLEQLYRTSPGYRDVGARLLEAYIRAGDAYAKAGDWCSAARKYERAVQFSANSSVAQKQQDADVRCLAAASAGGATAGFSTTVFNTAGITGRLFYSQYDPALYQYRYNVYDSAASKAYQIGMGAQPSYRASLSPDRTRAVYSIYQDGWKVVIAPADGSGTPTVLTSGSYPVWGPGGLIAYQTCTDQCGIHLINPDQPNSIRRLTTSSSDINMQWSPSGDRLIYMSNFPGSWEIFTVTLFGTFQQLTGYGANSGGPTFSPDGSRIAFISNRDGGWGVWIMNADGSNPIKLIDLGSQHPYWQTERLLWLQ